MLNTAFKRFERSFKNVGFYALHRVGVGTVRKPWRDDGR